MKILNLILLSTLCATMIYAQNSDILQQWGRKGAENKSIESSINAPANEEALIEKSVKNNDNVKIDIVKNFITEAQNLDFDESIIKYGTDSFKRALAKCYEIDETGADCMNFDPILGTQEYLIDSKYKFGIDEFGNVKVEHTSKVDATGEIVKGKVFYKLQCYDKCEIDEIYHTDESNGLFGVKEGLLETIATNSASNNTNEISQSKQEIANIKKPKVELGLFDTEGVRKDGLAFAGSYLFIQALSDNTIINDIIVNRGNCGLINRENLTFLSKPLKFGESEKMYFRGLQIWNYNVSPISSDFNVNPESFINFECNSESVLEIVLKTNGGDFHYNSNNGFE